MTHCFADRLAFEFQQLRKMTHWVDPYQEIAVLRDEIEVQRRLTEYWEGRWKQEYSEKLELLHQNMELKRKYEEISKETVAMAQGNTSMGTPEEAQRTGIARPQLKIFHAKKKGKAGRPFAKRGRGSGGVTNCSYCRKSNHIEVDCWLKGRRCLCCGSAEHLIANCPGLVPEKKGTQQPTKTDPGPSSGEGTGMKNLVSSDSDDEEGTGHWLL